MVNFIFCYSFIIKDISIVVVVIGVVDDVDKYVLCFCYGKNPIGYLWKTCGTDCALCMDNKGCDEDKCFWILFKKFTELQSLFFYQHALHRISF